MSRCRSVLKSTFLALLLPLAFEAVSWGAETKCLTLDWWASSDSNVVPRAIPGAYARVNDTAIHFDFVPGSAETIGGKLSRTSSKGCFYSDNLLVGTNTFTFSFVFTTGPGISGRASATFILEKGNSNERQLCKTEQGAGTSEQYSCRIEVPLSLAEISPETAAEIDSLKDRIAKLDLQLREMKAAGGSIEELEARLNAFARRDLETLSESELLSVAKELGSVAKLIESAKSDLTELRLKFAKEVEDHRRYAEVLRGMAERQLREEGIRLDPKDLQQRFSVESLVIPPPEIPSLGADPAEFNVEKNPYVDLRDRTLGKLQNALRAEDLVELNVIVETWSFTVATLATALEQRGSGARLNELKTFAETVRVVRELIDSNVDSFGFSKKSALPEDIRKTIREDIAPAQPERAKSLRDALNTWKSSERTPEQELVLHTVQGIGAGFKALAAAGEAAADVNRKLNSILDQAIEAARLAARTAVSFTPLNDFVDFCEIVTGREFCTPGGAELSVSDRALSAVGLVVGSGSFWRAVGQRFPILRMGAVAEGAAEVATAVSESERKLLKQLGTGVSKYSRTQREYLLKLVKSGQGHSAADLERIAKRYKDLEERMKTLKGSPVKEMTVWRGKKRQFVTPGKDPVEEVFKFDEFTKSTNNRYSLGGSLGDDAIYGSIGKKEDAWETVFEEMGNTTEDIILESKKFDFRKVLDLTDSENLRKLGLDIAEISKPMKNNANVYEIAQQLGNIANKLKFDALIVASAQQVGGKNVVIFP